MKMVVTRFQHILDVPESLPCENCSQICRKVWTTTRGAVDVSTDGHGILKIEIGVFHCFNCKRYFRSQPSFMMPRNVFTNRAINVAVASVIEDGMPITRVVRRMERDFLAALKSVVCRRHTLKK